MSNGQGRSAGPRSGTGPAGGGAVLILSQDYELFFHRSGTVEKCLFEPCDALLRSARKAGYRITFYVDAGMLCRMQDLAPREQRVAREFDLVRRHVEALAQAGHDIGLHVHPHWEETVRSGGGWRFEGTRYQLGQFTNDQAAEIVSRYATTLAEACGVAPTSYRAGGFCIEPFDGISSALLDAGIDVDSSVVPGAHLKNVEKGFDFRRVPSTDWWRFQNSPVVAQQDGKFLEIPVTPLHLPAWYYWRRIMARLSPAAQHFGDGSAKPVGRKEILRRLAGISRVAEASIDAAKVRELGRAIAGSGHRIWHVMGHPKNISRESLSFFQSVIREKHLDTFASVAGAAQLIRAGQLV
jgi:hypothetical protein